MSLNRHKRVNRTFPIDDNYFNTDPGQHLNQYSNEPWDNYSRDFNSLGYKSVSVINVSTSGTHDSSHYAYEEEAALPPGNSGKFHSVASFTELGKSEHYENQSEGIYVFLDDSISYVGKANWTYGAAIRLATDASAFPTQFIDSDVFRGGATEAMMVEDSNWSDYGGIIATSTDSAPDMAFRNITWDSSPGWSTHNYLLSTTGDRNYFGNNNYANFQTAQNIVPFEYDSSDVLAAGGGGGGDGGGGAAADPEAWS